MEYDEILKSIESKLDKLIKKSSTQELSSNKELYAALSSAQSEFLDMSFTGQNRYYHDKFATLSDLVRMSRPALCKNGLAVYQYLYQDEHDSNFLKTVLTHTSGETIASTMRILPNKNTIQQIGSYLAHMRRISYASLIGVMVHDADDDDGVKCMEEFQVMAEKGVLPSFTSQDTNTKEFERISRAELEELERSMSDCHDLGQTIMEQYHLSSLGDLPKSKYTFVLGQLRKNVARRKGDII